MIFTSHSQSKSSEKLIAFLTDKLGISDNALKLGQRQSELEQSPLPIVLWSFGLLTLKQLEDVLNWQDGQ